MDKNRVWGLKSPEPAGEEARPLPRLRTVDRCQMVLRPTDVEQLIEAHHPARAIWEIVGQQNLDGFFGAIEAVEGVAGRSAWDPRLLISLWIYAYTTGVSSAREISRLCRYHPAYQWLTGLEEINHHTLSDFRVAHQQALNELFVQILGVLSYEGLITLERVMHDGTKVKGWAADKSFRREGTLQKHLEAARQQVEEMGDPRSEELSERVAKARERAGREKQERLEAALEQLQQLQAEARSKKQKPPRVSATDPEARVMKQPDGGFAPSYNVQISSDAKADMIVGIGVSQAANDTAELPVAIERIKGNLGEAPQQVVVDGGFVNQGTIVAMEAQGIDLIGPMPDHASQAVAAFEKRGVAPEFFPQAFTYDAERNCYVCPAGRDLAFESQEKSEGSARYRYRAKLADCQGCLSKGQCCPQSQRRSLVRTEEPPEVKRHREKMASESAREIYKQRSQIAEFPNAWIKEKFGLRRFRLRGLFKVTMEAMWAAIAYNLSQWIRLCWKPKKAMGGASN
jgi:transposase